MNPPTGKLLKQSAAERGTAKKPVAYRSKKAAAKRPPGKPISYQGKGSRALPLQIAPKDLRPHPLLGRVGMLSDLIAREVAKGNKDGEKRQIHKAKAEALGEELAAIRESIREEGIKDVLKVCKSAKGKWLILDGRHRTELAGELELATVPCKEFPESEARAIIMAAAVRRHVSKGARAYQTVTFYPEVATEAVRGKHTPSSAVSADDLATKTGVSKRTMEDAIWLFRAFADRPDMLVEFEPSIYAGSALEKIKGAVAARLKGNTEADENDEEEEDPSNDKVLSVAGGSTETNTLRNTFDVLVLNDLTSDTAWFLMESGRAIKPLLIQFEVRPEFIAADDPKSTHVLLQKVFFYQAYGRWNAGYALPMLAYGSTGLT